MERISQQAGRPRNTPAGTGPIATGRKGTRAGYSEYSHQATSVRRLYRPPALAGPTATVPQPHAHPKASVRKAAEFRMPRRAALRPSG